MKPEYPKKITDCIIYHWKDIIKNFNNTYVFTWYFGPIFNKPRSMSVSLMLSLKIVLNKFSLKINCTFDETSRTETFFTHILERKTLKLTFYKLTSLVLVNKIMALIAVKMRFFSINTAILVKPATTRSRSRRPLYICK
jgi:hypothetical protein